MDAAYVSCKDLPCLRILLLDPVVPVCEEHTAQLGPTRPLDQRKSVTSVTKV